MGSIAEKLQYTYNAVDDIQLAINEMGVQTDDETPLGYYGDKIREIANVNGNNIIGNINNVNTFDCITLDSFAAYNTSTLTSKTIEDVSSAYQF